ncbi:sensor histidine kinase [Occallatibacter savannae]|uniref:sensor histidine kinase n=1 Tax=Occallatibacter savannae TaxID=1002691 RepID=UPI0013A59E63|nr:histidine kinase [Occallatibacter savannae]
MENQSTLDAATADAYKMRLFPFLGSFMAVALLFAVQSWLNARIWYPRTHVNSILLISAWEVQYFLWGVICWLLWLWHGEKLRQASWRYLLFVMGPLSVVLGIGVEMVLVGIFPQLTMAHGHLTFWQRLDFSLGEEFLENTAVFWAAYAIARGLGHYRESRQREKAMSKLAVELAEARMMALRMQINPHFLFNTMNAISSLMYSDAHAADRMMEQLSNMLRVSLARGSKQMITLQEEMEFNEMYLALQDIRSSGRVRQEIDIDPHLHDALIPAMLLQPIVENAYVHGLSKVCDGAFIEIAATQVRDMMEIVVRNLGAGLASVEQSGRTGAGIGLGNIRSRLQLHLGERAHLSISESSPGVVEVKVRFPLTFASMSEQNEASGVDRQVLYEPTRSLVAGSTR